MAGFSPVVVRKVWRSELILLGLFAVSLPIAIILSNQIPSSIVTGEVFSFGGRRLMLSLPLFWLVPLGFAGYAAFRIFDVQYLLDGRGVEARVGRLSFSQRINRVRYEDVRSIEIRQTLLQRALGIGNLEIGTAGTSEVELVLRGIGTPSEVQELVQNERDLRQETQKNPVSSDGIRPVSNRGMTKDGIAASA